MDSSMTHRSVLAISAAVAVAAATALVAAQPRPFGGGGTAFPVSYWKSTEVSAAFARGAVLFDGGDGRNFMVHASHREVAGMAEVHERDTDIIYVLEGEARFVTGGRVVAGQEIAPDEIRGPRIEGGTARALSKGEVVVVPNGTPHWFESVPGPFVYYVVKVTSKE
jgi:glc operon protein GlcG